jgi:homoserine dehydrogenase
VSDGDPAAGPVREYRLCLLGLGRVTRRFCELVAEREELLARTEGVRLRIVAVGTAGRGSLVTADPMPAGDLLALLDAAGGRLPEPVRPGTDLLRAAAAAGADVLVESTVAEGAGAPVATAHVRAALESGLDVVTVNKGPIAWHHRELTELARRTGRSLRHEGVTMDGVPVFNLVQLCLPAARVESVGGVLNSTTNYVLDALAEGRTVAAAVADAVRLGFAEADPEHDLAGDDTATKLAVLANVLLDADVTPDDVPRVDVRQVTASYAQQVHAAGRRLRIVARAARTGSGARRRDGGVELAVDLREVGPQDPAFAVDAMSSLFTMTSDLAGTIDVVERRGTLTQTAYAVLGDLLQIARADRAGDRPEQQVRH